MTPLISGTLNQKDQEFTILDSLARDINPDTGIPHLLSKLEGWKTNCAATKDALLTFDAKLSAQGKMNEADQAALKDKADESIKLVQLRAEKESISGHRGMGRDMFFGQEIMSNLITNMTGGRSNKSGMRMSRQKDP